MDRRELLKMIAILTGGAVVGAEAILSGCNTPAAEARMTFNAEDITLLDEVGETILPKTKTPGAKDAKIGQFMTVIVNDCYEEDDQKIFHEGIVKLDEACKKMHGHKFMDAKPEERQALLVSLDKEAKDAQKKRDDFNKEEDKKEKAERDKGNLNYKKAKLPAHYFTLMKQLTLWGYFTSKEGVTQALNYTPVPGRFDPCIDYKKGDRAFAGLDG
jgi:hypothetical protein